MCVVDGDWYMDLDKLGYIEGDKIVVLQYLVLVLLALLVLHSSFYSLLVPLSLFHLVVLCVIFQKYFVVVVYEGS